MSQHPLNERLIYEFLRFLFRILAVIYFHARFFGQKNIPSQGGVLVVSNHQSFFDPPLAGIGATRHMNYLARETLFRFPIFAWIIHRVNAIPLDREGLGLSGIKESIRRLKRGEIVVLFPEGTRSPDGQIKPFRPGFTSLAVRTKATILPMAIEGAQKCWPRSRVVPISGEIYVYYGRPILPEQYAVMDERELMQLVEQRVRECREYLLEKMKSRK